MRSQLGYSNLATRTEALTESWQVKNGRVPSLTCHFSASNPSGKLKPSCARFCREEAEASSDPGKAESQANSPIPTAKLHSRGFPSLRLPVAPLLAGDTTKVLQAVTQKAAAEN